MDYTGTGNSLNVRHPHSLQLIMDSLRYWVTEMHVDGFRFDLAAALAREFYDVDRLSTFFELVQQDPVVSQVKLIAEPWDVGPGGYQVGNFPPQWTEWNGDYRDTVRDFWRGEPSLGEFASAGSPGSSDLYEHSGRRPVASINFVTAHDGFTLRDLVSYNEKHNDANGEDNNDGESHNRSWNHGVEGPTDDPEILELRAPAAAQLPRHAAAQPGRADARCTATSSAAPRTATTTPTPRTPRSAWMHWDERRQAAGRVHRRGRRGCAATTRRSAASASSPARPVRTGERRARSTTSSGCTPTAARWRTATGTRRRAGDRHVPQRRRHRRHATPAAAPITDDHFLLYFNAAADGVELTLPPEEYAAAWDVVIDTARPARTDEPLAAGATVDLEPAQRRSCSASTREPEAEPDHSVAASVAAHGRAAPRPTGPDEPRPVRRTERADAHTAQHLPAADHRRLRPVRGRARRCPTCTTWASTGSTSRRCSRPSPAATTATTSSPTTGSTPPAAAPTGLAALSAEARAARHGRARRHRAQPRRRRHPARERLVVGRAHARPRLRATPPRSTSTGTSAAAGSGSRSLGDDDLQPDGRDRAPDGRRRRAALPRPPLPARSRHRRRRATTPTRCTPGSTTSWSSWRRADPS